MTKSLFDMKNIIQGTPEWIAWRALHLGASEAAAILGKSKFQTPYQLWCEKTGRAQGFEGNAATLRGSEIEAKARASYEVLNGFIDMPPECVEHPAYKFLSASLDGISEDRKTILEIKYPSQESHDLALHGTVPEHYFIQCQHQLMCVPEAEVVHYWSYREGNGALVKVYPDLKLIEIIMKAEFAFWDLVQSDIAPPLTDKDAKLVDSGEVKNICEILISIKEDKSKSAKIKADELKSKVIKLGGHPRIRCGNVLITESKTKSGEQTFRMTISGGKSA